MKEQAELSRLMDDVNETAQRIKTRLTNLDDAIKQKAASDSDANARIKRTLHSSAQKKVLHIFAITNNAHSDFKNKKFFF
jgi:transglutaminase/protease-like cytokinesis protein 3